ncbi:glycosyltransferase 87 family protein [Saccharothrix texasensis]|uniref:Alpha-1,2-mannosyltransferase n=1 Tax=Saccharothrix texasensis TaxID=103734 RepID=A0A3N1GXH7_9PSEU|nr:glycosyltransferase 87 family protein [Saccharothrix texasensis]ROP34970.1 alpha-1,2-mannosyltransferase [Saccharothrix texasensis]
MPAAQVPATPATGSGRLPAGLVLAGLAIAAALGVAVVASLPLRDKLWLLEVDFKVYHMAGSVVLDGISPFDVATDDGFLFIYPPIAALFFVPLGLLNVHVAFGIWTFLNVIALEIAVWLGLGLLAPQARVERAKFAVLVTAVALPTATVIMNLGAGQVNIALLLLVLADLARKPGRFQGVALGIAAGLKLTPLIFVAYFILTGRIRAAVVSMVSFVGTVVVAFILLPGPSARWWGELVLATERMTPPGTGPYIQSMRGVLAQMPGVLSAPWLWFVLAGIVGVAGLAISSWYSRHGMEAIGIFSCAVTGLIISPISWPQHWVWLIPALAMWLWWARQRRSAAHTAAVAVSWLVMVVMTVLIFMLVGGALSMPTAGIVAMSSVPVLAGLAFLVVLAVARRRLVNSPTAQISQV